MKIKYSFEQWCLDNNHRDYLDLWDYKLNNKSPSEIGTSSRTKCYFKCPRGIHKSELKDIHSITRYRCLRCGLCASLGQWMIDNLGDDAIVKYWSDKNHFSPFEVSAGSTKRVYFKCQSEIHPDYLCLIHNFTDGQRCPVCRNKVIISGVNDIATTHPQYVKYFKNSEDAMRYSVHSGRVCVFKCPFCGYEKEMYIYRLDANGFSCDVCGDGISYPEKFMMSVLLQLIHDRDFLIDKQHTFDWSKKIEGGFGGRIYDFYLQVPYDVIIEVHGGQHFIKAFLNRTLNEEQNNDLLKYNLAIDNGILPENYIVIDARYSTQEWIKTSIMNSNLPSILNFSANDIDWDACDIKSQTSLVKDCCDLWNSGLRSTFLIGERKGMSDSSVLNYLTRGASLGLCDFERSDLYKLSIRKPIMCIDNNIVFASRDDCCENSMDIFGIQINKDNLSSAASGYHKTAHGFRFKYITKKEFLQIKFKHPELAFGNVYFYDAYNFVG